MGKVASPQLLTMQLGGNNAHFTDIAVACLYVGDRFSSQKDYPDPDGTCYQTITQWETYLDASADAGAGQSFYFDHHEALQAIMESEVVKGRDDFYLYIVSYTEFFNTSPESDWCNDQSFGLIKKPKLSNALRSKLNELVRKINAAITQSTSDMNNEHIRSLDPSLAFEHHRFCEPQHTLNNQYFLNDVCFWNISPPEDDPNYLTIQDADAVQSAWAQNHTFINGTTGVYFNPMYRINQTS
jgi:hypothetical protein